MSQPRLKSLRNRTSTQTKHSEAFNDPQLQASYNPDQDLRFIAPISTGFMNSYPFHFMPFNTMPFNVTMAEQIIQQNHNVHQDVFTSLPLKQIAGGGMRIVCEIDMQLLRNYYPLRELYSESYRSDFIDQVKKVLSAPLIILFYFKMKTIQSASFQAVGKTYIIFHDYLTIIQKPLFENIYILNNRRTMDVIPTKIFKNCAWISKSLPPNKKKSTIHPARRWGHTAVICDKYMYVFSGCGKVNSAHQWEQVYKMDCNTFQWERIPSQIHPCARDSHTSVMVQNKMYIFGGSANDLTLGDLWCFDIDSNTWSEIPTDPNMHAREGHSMAQLSNRLIYIQGGYDQADNKMQETHWLFDVETHKFMQVTNFSGHDLTKLESHSCNMINGSMYIFGGQGAPMQKNGQFSKDLFKLDFEDIKSLEEKFSQQEDYQEDSAIQVQPHETTINIEKVKHNGTASPSPRASHSAVAYGDRFLFIIGGEGYESDLVHDNDPEQDEQQMQNSGDEEDKPIFPKSDIWIFEVVMKTWSKLQPRSRAPVFQPRFSHSCVVYKDQLIVFGGLREMNDILEDVMVLHLKDSDSHLQKFQRDEMKNVCRYCQLIYGIQVEDEICVQRTIESNAEQIPRVSMSYISDVSKLIRWPFSAFGLFLDNAAISECKELQINYTLMQRRKVYSNSICEIDEKVPIITIMEIGPKQPITDFHSLIYNFEAPQLKVCLHKEDKEFIVKNGPQAEDLLKSDEYIAQQKIYSIQLKMAALRLAQSILIVSKQGGITQVALISANTQINQNTEAMIIHSYSVIDKKLDNQENKYIIQNSIAHILAEEDYLHTTPQNYFKIILFDLYKLPGNKYYELSSNGEDILNNNFTAYDLKLDNASQMIDFSLKQYISNYSLTTLPFQVQLCTFISTTDVKTKNALHPRLKDCAIAGILEQKLSSQGILLYYRNRLISRFPYHFGMYRQQSLVGYLHLADHFSPNISKDGFQNEYLSQRLYSLIWQAEGAIEDQDVPARKEVKI